MYYYRSNKAQMDERNYHHRHVCPSACNSSNPTKQIIMKFDIWMVLEKLSTKLKFH